MRIDFLGLQAFVSVAERGSFLRAAAHLNLSQTALSHRMKKFEEDLGVALFVRTTRQVSLTAVGLELLPRACALLDELSDTLEGVRGTAPRRSSALPSDACRRLRPISCPGCCVTSARPTRTYP
jgi:DNA-binding transcriptional LysR family regulator